VTTTPTNSHWIIYRREDVASPEGIEVYVVGVREPDGTVQREIVVHQPHDGHPITTQQALQLGRALFAAVDEINRSVTE
jgi:hypothetical protein